MIAGFPLRYAQISESLRDYCDSARSLACCVSLALKDARLSQSKRQELAEADAGQAVRLLREAIQRGYKDLDSLKTDPALEVLRSRADFQQMLTGLEPSGKGVK
jgi:hypothetical protein